MNQGEKKKSPLIFISHIVEEKTVAIELKKLIERSFPDGFEIFVSSDDETSAILWSKDIPPNVEDL